MVWLVVSGRYSHWRAVIDSLLFPRWSPPLQPVYSAALTNLSLLLTANLARPDARRHCVACSWVGLNYSCTCPSHLSSLLLATVMDLQTLAVCLSRRNASLTSPELSLFWNWELSVWSLKVCTTRAARFREAWGNGIATLKRRASNRQKGKVDDGRGEAVPRRWCCWQTCEKLIGKTCIKYVSFSHPEMSTHVDDVDSWVGSGR